MLNYDYAMYMTSEEECTKAIDNQLDVVSAIEKEIATDTENDSMYLLRMYKEANDETRALMDAMLIAICGWAMSHIIEKAEPNFDLISLGQEV